MDAKRPLMLGVVGDSAAGKTTLTRGVGRLLGAAGVTPICLDDYHRYGREDRLRRGLTASDPAANDLPLMAEHLAALRAGGVVSKPCYDHRVGKVRGTELVAATGLVIAYGMLTLTPPELARLFDLTIYLEPDEELRRRWRLERDVAQRGYTAAEVQAQEPARRRDAARFIHNQRRHADLVLRFAPVGAGPLRVELIARRSPATAPLVPFLAVAGAAGPGVAVRHLAHDADDREVNLLALDPAPPAPTMAALQNWLAERLPARPDLARLGTIGGGPTPPRSDTLALLQLLVAYLLVSRP